jgi:hypothetical protein
MTLKNLIRLLTNIYNAEAYEKRFNMLNDILRKQLDLEVMDDELNVYNINPNPKDNPWEPIDEAETTGN